MFKLTHPTTLSGKLQLWCSINVLYYSFHEHSSVHQMTTELLIQELPTFSACMLLLISYANQYLILEIR